MKWIRGSISAALAVVPIGLAGASGNVADRPNPHALVVAGDGHVTFPASWTSGGIGARAIPLDVSESARSKRIVAQAMSLYPTDLLDSNLAAVYVVKELSFYGVRYGGTNSINAVYISNAGEASGFSDRYIAATFHHEFSSILLRNFARRFDERAWREANSHGDFYRKTGTQSLIDGTADTTYNPTYHVYGFLNQYGTSSVEEDFNTYAEALFSGDQRFWDAVLKFPRVAAKKDLAIAFYQSLNGEFDEQFFTGVANE